MRTIFFVPEKNILCYALLAVACLLAAGCSESQEPNDAEVDGVEVIEPLATPATDATSPSEAVELIEPEPLSASESQQADYVPPYPGRTNLFEPLRQANRLARTKGGKNSESVVLMGFANLGTAKVVLSIDGVVTPLADGDEEGGVKVISIAPPMAVLQRGRSRWTATLE